MRRRFSMPALVLAAGLALSFPPGSGYPREPASSEGGSGQPGGHPGVMDSAPQGRWETLGDDPGDVEQEGERPDEQDAGTGQEQSGIAPRFEEESPAQSEDRRQERFEAEPGEMQPEQFGGATGEGPPFGAGEQERFGSEPERLQQEQMGVGPKFEENDGAGQGWIRPERERSGTGWRRKSRVPEGGR